MHAHTDRDQFAPPRPPARLRAITLAVLVCSFTDLPQTPDWRQSFSAVYFEALAQLAVPYLPPVVADQVQYPTL